MADFITRVELHGAVEADYERLHGYMEAAKFRRWIHAGAVRYRLPTATYHSNSDTLNAEGVRDLARGAAAQTGKRYWVITTMGPSAWDTERWV